MIMDVKTKNKKDFSQIKRQSEAKLLWNWMQYEIFPQIISLQSILLK